MGLKMTAWCKRLSVLVLFNLVSSQQDNDFSNFTRTNKSSSNSLFGTTPEVLGYGTYETGEQNTSVFLGIVPQQNNTQNSTQQQQEIPLAQNQIEEPIQQYTGDYEDGENLGAYLLDLYSNSDDLNSSEITTFISLVNDMEVLEDICGLGSVTVFAPNEFAFDEFLEQEQTTRQDLVRFSSNRQKLLKVLQTHVVKAQIQELTAQNNYLTINQGQLVEIFQNEENLYGIKTESNSAVVQGAVFRAIDCKDFAVAAVVINQVLLPTNVSQ